MVALLNLLLAAMSSLFFSVHFMWSNPQSLLEYLFALLFLHCLDLLFDSYFIWVVIGEEGILGPRQHMQESLWSFLDFLIGYLLTTALWWRWWWCLYSEKKLHWTPRFDPFSACMGVHTSNFLSKLYVNRWNRFWRTNPESPILG